MSPGSRLEITTDGRFAVALVITYIYENICTRPYVCLDVCLCVCM